MRQSIILGLSLAALTTFTISCSSSQKTEVAAPAKVLPMTLEEAVKSTYRNPENMKRDQYRHPLETLKFFGVTPEMTVVEVSPGAGWYMEILAPYLSSKGQYIAAVHPVTADNAYMNELHAKITDWLKQNPEVGDKAKLTEFNPPTQVDIAPAGTADRVLTFRNVHNWMARGNEKAAFQAFFKALKPGGVLGVVEHRASPKSKRDPKAKNGYVLQKDVIKLAESVGFVLDGQSEINANPKDTKNHPEGVWTLPPSLRLKDKDKEKYLAIGESDRMTLKFIKPIKGAL